MNAFNECSHNSFLSRHSDLSFSLGFSGATTVLKLYFGPHHILSMTSVQQGDPLGPLLFPYAP